LLHDLVLGRLGRLCLRLAGRDSINEPLQLGQTLRRMIGKSAGPRPHFSGITMFRKIFQLSSACSCHTVRYFSTICLPPSNVASAGPHSYTHLPCWLVPHVLTTAERACPRLASCVVICCSILDRPVVHSPVGPQSTASTALGRNDQRHVTGFNSIDPCLIPTIDPGSRRVSHRSALRHAGCRDQATNRNRRYD
jgi:hypothetical protein